MARSIGIRHRVKRTAEGESRPTMVAILEDGKLTTNELPDDQAELDWLLGRFPTSRRQGTATEAEKFPAHQVEWKRGSFTKERTPYIPVTFDGLKPGDMVAMTFGGSGDRLAAALSRRGNEIGASLLRITPFKLKAERPSDIKEEDHVLLARLVEAQPALFQEMTPRDRDLIRVREAYFARVEAMKARIACEQRIRQHFIGSIFLSEEGGYPEGAIEAFYDERKANDVIFTNLTREEARRESELKKAVRKLDVWRDVLADVEGCGEVIAAGIISAIGDIRRFPRSANLKAYCGVHVLAQGEHAANPTERQFPRKRAGTVANWNPAARQALYQFGQQIVFRKDSVWGCRLRANKEWFRSQHPETVLNEQGKKRYTDAHIHKMAIWRTLTQFTEWLFAEWWQVERGEKVTAAEVA